ncbi:MAG: nucleoside 2-deoxyribosyltransferase [Thermomicrobia bacterium]|nr:nucleoside 2-deoxyribosyltransferase [Thermomicrobia bacterium]MCA1724538.1 nucleoside 2-deoxyribosyltransferase [Thermomicrobia bacterium]
MKVYLASPLGFAASTKPYMDELECALAGTGIAVINPWKSDFGTAFQRANAIADFAARVTALGQVNTAVARKNEQSIRAADAVLAVLDGVDVDSGTASEMGFAFALGKRVHGLRTDTRLIGDNAGSVINLQVQYWIEASGGRLVRTLEEAVALFRSE